MIAAAVARSAFATSLLRYTRGWGLWLILLIAPVGAKFMIPRGDGESIVIAVNGRIPTLDSGVLGVSLGIVVTTLLLPVAFIYLRAGATRRQPWQVEEVAPASRVAIALGRFGADAAVLAGALAALTLAGWFLGWLMLPPGELRPHIVAFGLWLVAAPALAGVAALRILFDARPWLRYASGDALYFAIWIASLTAAIVSAGRSSGFVANLWDFGGFVRPLIHDAPKVAEPSFVIGGADVLPGTVDLDVVAGLMADGYALSRLAWLGIAVAVAALAGLVYAPHRAPRRALSGRIAPWLSAAPAPAADPAAPPAPAARWPFAGLVAAEARLIGSGRLFGLVALAIALSGLAADFRHAVSPASLLLLIFGLTAHAGRSEASGLRSLTALSRSGPAQRRIAFVLAGIAWSIALAIPAILAAQSPEPLLLALVTGGAASLAAIALAALSGSAFAPRLVLLIAWYVYFSA